MRTYMTALGLLAAALPAAPAAAADPPAAGFQPFAFLAGSCWRATLPDGRMTDTHCFTSMLGGRFLRDRHRIAGADYAGETIYRWDAAAGQIRWDYYASDGMLMSGTAAAGSEGGVAFEVVSVSPQSAAPVPMRIAWRRDGTDAYVVTTEVRAGDSWRAAPNAPRFQRVGPAPAE
jgi:hypothetical protein